MPSRQGAKYKTCFNCKESGHVSQQCPKPRGILNWTCGGCRQKGHTTNDCPNRDEWVCKNCTEQGHGHWECEKPKGYRYMRCGICSAVGHVARFCNDRPPCPRCKQHGHAVKSCPLPKNCKAKKRGGVDTHNVECYATVDVHSPSSVDASEDTARSTPTLASEFGYEASLSKEYLTTSKPISRCNDCGSQEHIDKACCISKNKSSNSTNSSDACESHPNLVDEPPTVESQVANLCKRANELMQLTELDDAIALLSQAIELDPSDSRSYFARGAAHALNGHHSAALIDFDTASTKRNYAPSKTNFLQIARSRLLLGSSSAALLAVRSALALDAGDADALLLRSRIVALEAHVAAYNSAVSRNHWHMARSAYESCLGIYAQEDSDAPPSIRCWGIALLVVESAWDDARKSVNVLLREVPDNVDAMNLRALTLFLQGKIPEAIEQITASLKLDPDNTRAKALRTRFKEVSRLKDSGNDKFRQSKWSDAISLWTDALQVVDEREDEGHGGIMRATLLLNRATANQKLRKFTEGLKDIDESLNLHPKYFKAHLCRARIMVGLEMYETAATEFRAALEHGQGTIKPSDVCGIELEVEHAEACAMKARSKEQDHYSVLGLSRTCTAADIKKAYRTLSLKHHPDKGGLAEKFKIIAAAYEVLSDPEQKRMYDAKQQLRGFGSRGGYWSTPEYDRYQDEYDSDYAYYAKYKFWF